MSATRPTAISENRALKRSQHDRNEKTYNEILGAGACTHPLGQRGRLCQQRFRQIAVASIVCMSVSISASAPPSISISNSISVSASNSVTSQGAEASITPGA